MKHLYTYIKEDCVIIQNKEYIEDGPYIKIKKNNQVELWEIPLFGGADMLIKKCSSIHAAIKEMNETC